MKNIQPTSLRGNMCCLIPLSLDHCNDLVASVQDGELWKLWYTSIPHPEKMAAEIERRLALQAAGTMLPFAIVDAQSKQALGMTSFLNIDMPNKRLEIGATWLRKAKQQTGINTEAKLLLLSYAFQTLACIAVELRTHYCNLPSRNAIEKLGAKLDGILRNHIIMQDGSLRDTCVYSILTHEWPAIKNGLLARLSRIR